jgi:hypothetical protein
MSNKRCVVKKKEGRDDQPRLDGGKGRGRREGKEDEENKKGREFGKSGFGFFGGGEGKEEGDEEGRGKRGSWV